MKTFDNEWICQVFEDHPSFFTKRMFGGLAIYLFGRQMMLLVEPTKSGRWNWHGVLICTEYVHQPAIVEEFPHLAPHDILKKWLYIDSVHDDFEGTMERVAVAVARDDPRFGIHPQPRKAKTKKKAGSRTRRQKTVTSLVVAMLSVPVLAQVERASGPVQADDLTPYAGTYTIETPGVAKANYLEVMAGYLRGSGVAFSNAERKEQFRAHYDRIENDATMATVVSDENGHSWVVHAPTAAAEDQPHGLFVFISPRGNGSVPEHWRETLEKNALIWVGPNGAGNQTSPLWRRAVALESIDLATARYEIDPDRIYVSGHSGGARVASSVAIIHPDRFMGGVYVAGVNWYEPTPPREGRFLPPTIGKPPDSFLTLTRDRSRHAIIQGTDDPVATYVPSLWDVIKNGGFRTFEYLSVEGLGHGLPDAEWLDKALVVLDTPLRDGAAR